MTRNGKRWTVDNIRADRAVGESSVARGTAVRAQVDLQTTPPPETCSEFSKDFKFVRTRPSVKLLRFVSGSEARRLPSSLDSFTEVDVDLAGVQDFEHGFGDEVRAHRRPGRNPRRR